MGQVINSLSYGGNNYPFTIPYGVCQTSYDEANKTVTVDADITELVAGQVIAVLFYDYDGSTSNCTLNVNGLGAKPMLYSCLSHQVQYAEHYKGWGQHTTQIFIYDGNYWIAPNYKYYNISALNDLSAVISVNTSKRSITTGHGSSATGENSFAEGYDVYATGYCSHAEGATTSAAGDYSHAEGFNSSAAGDYSHAAGHSTIANSYQFVVGRYNRSTTAPTSLEDKTASAGLFMVGIGTGSSARSNGFRINPAGKPYALSTMSSSGADYAEYFEWMDGNPANEDRRGRFVTLDGDKIRYATAEDDYILGVVSAEPTVVGDIQSEAWHNMYLKDIYGERIVEVVEVEESVDEHGNTIPAHTERRWVLNPDYNPEKKYTSREERPEWDAIGIVGKLVVVDDGTCQVNGYCYPGTDGIATMSEGKTAYRVIERLDDTHIRIFIK